MTFIPQKETSKRILPRNTLLGTVYHYRPSEYDSPETLLRVYYSDETGDIHFLVISNEYGRQGEIIAFQPLRAVNLTPIKGELYMEIK